MGVLPQLDNLLMAKGLLMFLTGPAVRVLHSSSSPSVSRNCRVPERLLNIVRGAEAVITMFYIIIN